MFAVFSAFYLGLLCAVSPCPLATNLAAVSFVGRKIGTPRAVFYAGILYVFGRTLTFAGLGLALSAVMSRVPEVAHILQKYTNLGIGPVLIVVSLILLNLISVPVRLKSSGGDVDFCKKMDKAGLAGAFLLGMIFALSFCPVSAALFFGTLLPLAIKTETPFLLSGVFGAAGGLPVVAFSLVFAFGAGKIGKFYSCVSNAEKWTQRMTGIVFLFLGIYFTLTQTLGL